MGRRTILIRLGGGLEGCATGVDKSFVGLPAVRRAFCLGKRRDLAQFGVLGGARRANGWPRFRSRSHDGFLLRQQDK